jgi:hypothetical protein
MCDDVDPLDALFLGTVWPQRLRDVRVRQRPNDVAGRQRAALGGPSAGLVLPDPPPDAAELVARLWAGTEMPVDHDGTVTDALREGLGILAQLSCDFR